MTIAALIVAALALGLAAAAIYLAVQARGDALTCRRELSRHRKAHADGQEERRAGRRASAEPEPYDERAWLGREPLPDEHPPTAPVDAFGPATEALAAQDAPTREARAVQLPRPGRIGGGQ